MTDIEVKHATPDDAEALATLLQEVDRFYDAESAPITEKVEGFGATLFGERPTAACLIAWQGDKPIGLAAYSFLWPATGVSTSLYLKELYVAEAHRDRGAGRILMRELCAIAREKGCSRVEWTADRDNPGAQRFYDRLGAAPVTSKIFYRLDATALHALR